MSEVNHGYHILDSHLEGTKLEDHPLLVKGFTHWSSPGGWDAEKKCPISVLTFDPDCPACQKLAEENKKKANPGARK